MDYTNPETIKEIEDWLKENLTEERYLHSLGTRDSAVELAKMFNLDKDKARIAGLLHDCAKCVSNEELLEIIKKHLSDVDECELLNYKTLHAPVSAYIAENKFGIKDSEILSSIRWHTLGKCGMSEFEKIIFIADKIEKNTREHEFNQECLNTIQEKDGINKVLLCCYKRTICSLVDRNLAICHITIDVYNELLKELGYKL